MTDQQIGYYETQKDALLNEFDHTASLVEGYLVKRYGEELAAKLRADIRREYENLIPHIPFIPGFRAKFLCTFLLITAQELAAYKACKKLDKSAGEAWELCHKALCLRLAEVPKWKVWLMKQFMFSGLVKKIMQRRAGRGEIGQFGDFEIEYLSDEGNDFDVGVNYLGCGHLNFVKEHGGEEFAPYVCLSDMALSDALGWGLIRTQTLSDGCQRCDFRFKEGESTCISSQTPEVQEVIEKICQSEE